jgi:hypothetical protein
MEGVSTLEVRELDGGKTVLLVLGLGLSACLVTALIVAATWDFDLGGYQ